MVVWGILLKGMSELKKKVLEDDVANITRSGKHYVEDQKCDKEVHSMKSKERPWALTKEGPAREVKKDHEGLKAQKEGKRKGKKSKK